MTTFHTIRKNIALGAVLAATGLPASLAQAQFKVEYRDSKDAPKSQQNKSTETAEERVIGITSDDGDHSYEVKVVNGIVTVAKLDGKELDRDRVKIENEVVLFLSKDGKTIHEIKLPGTALISSPDSPKPVRGLTWVSNDNQNDNKFVVDVQVEQPRVMLGINLTEPSDAMRKQLKLGSDQKVILVEKVIDGLPAQKAGLEDFDVILSIDGSDFANGELLSKVLREKSPGDELKLVILRSGDKIKIAPTLTAYNAQKLGVPALSTVTRLGEDLSFPAPPPSPAPGKSFWFGEDMMPQIHEHLSEALHSAGLSDEEVARVQEQLRGHMKELGSQFFFSNDDKSARVFGFTQDDAHPEHEHEHDLEHQHAVRAEQAQQHTIRQQIELAEVARDKARQAMRDVERQVMEMRDGRLIVRSAERVEDQMGALEDRLAALEDRLESQMEQFESQMERMADMFERMLERLERDRD